MVKRRDAPEDGFSLQSKLGAVIRTSRQRLGITQEELAWRADMHRTYVADIERGGRNITLRSIAKLAEALEISIESLISQAVGGGETPVAGPTSFTPAMGEILLVEDNAADAELTVRAFQKAHFTNPVRVVRDGAEALHFLFCTGRYAKRKNFSPQLVLLDLNLPKVSGVEVLRRIKGNESTRAIPVVVLTVSAHDKHVSECGQLGAAHYMIKPVSFENLCKIIPKLLLHWALIESPRSVVPLSW